MQLTYGHMLLQGEPLALLYFALDCADFPVPKLHYTPVIAPASAVVNSLTGYDVPFYSLPDLNQFNKCGPWAFWVRRGVLGNLLVPMMVVVLYV
jgi:hypothetical protein